jgi:hypothetical protein
MDLSKLEKQELGKYFEYLFGSELIRLQFGVFVPLIDKGIDLIVREKGNASPRYFEIQVKSVRKEGGRLTVGQKTFIPNDRLFLAFFYVKDPERGEYDFYMIPSRVVKDKFRDDTQNKQKIYRLNINKKSLETIESYKLKDFGSIRSHLERLIERYGRREKGELE